MRNIFQYAINIVITILLVGISFILVAIVKEYVIPDYIFAFLGSICGSLVALVLIAILINKDK